MTGCVGPARALLFRFDHLSNPTDFANPMPHDNSAHPSHAGARDAIAGRTFFAEGGQTGRELAAFDWTTHPLGHPQDWDPLLLAMVNSLLSSVEAEYLLWGDERWFFSNDAYRPVLGPRVADAIGRTLPALWPDAWPAVKDMVDRGFSGVPTSVKDYHIRMARHGVPEDTWWTFSYSPVRDAAGRVRGLRCLTLEQTEAVATAARLQESEAWWQALFTKLQEALLVGELVRGPDGRAFDVRMIEYNPSWRRLGGFDDKVAPGATVREVLGDIDHYWIDLAVEVVDTQAPVSFTRQVGREGGWYDGVAQPLAGDQFVLVLSNVSDRVRAEQLRAELEQRRRLAVEIGDVGLWDIDLRTETVDWDRKVRALFGAAEGRVPVLRDMVGAIHPDDRAEFERRFAGACTGTDVFDMKFRVFGLDDRIERWASMKGVTLREDDAPTSFVGAMRDITRRVRNEQRRATLNHELAHRLKNTLSVVSAIVSQTLRDADDIETGRQSTLDRIRALSSAHDVVMTGQSNAAAIRSIIEGAAAVHGQGRRIVIDGPDVTIGSRSALSLSLIVHELATNAGKYGALSVPDGRVHLTWSVRDGEGAAGPVLAMDWVESGGPTVVAPEHTGFGTQLLEMGLADAGAGWVRIVYDPDGVKCHLTAPLADVMNNDDGMPEADDTPLG